MKPRSHWVHPEVEKDIATLIADPSPDVRYAIGQMVDEVFTSWLDEGPPTDLVSKPHAYINEFQLYVFDEFDCTFLFGWRETSGLISVFAITRMNRRNNAPYIVTKYRSRVEQYP